MSEKIVVGGRECAFLQQQNVFDELVWRIEGYRPFPAVVAQIPTWLDHNGKWRELGSVGGGTLIDWPTEADARAFARQHADPPAEPSDIESRKAEFRAWFALHFGGCVNELQADQIADKAADIFTKG